MPALWQYKKAEKLAKLAIYAENVWDIREGSDEEKADQAIRKTAEFFETMGLKTRLSEYNLNEAIIPEVIEKLGSQGLNALGERADITLEDTAEILRLAL